MNESKDLDDQIRDMKHSDDALDQSIALNRIVVEFLKSAKETNRQWRKVFVIVALVNAICIVAICGMFLHYESQFTTTEEVKTVTTTVNQDTGNSPGNNIYQSGENAQYNEAAEEVTEDGQADNQNNHDNQNPDQNP